MDNIAGSKSSLTWAVQLSVVGLVVLWLLPTFGLFVSSFRTVEQISSSGWWKAMFPSEQNLTLRAADPDDFRMPQGDLFVVKGNLFEDEGISEAEISVWGTSSRDVAAYTAGETADLGDGETITVQSNGAYVWSGTDDQISGRGDRKSVV